jgi:O-antigen/teichoic acid export membrane protein
MSTSETSTSESPPETPASRLKKEGGVMIARNSLWLMVDSVAGMFSSFYVSVMAARRLGPDYMGHFNYIMTFAAVLRMITEVAIPGTVRKFASELNGREEFSTVKTLVRRAMRLQVRITAVGISIGLAIVYLWFPKEHHLVATLAVMAILPGMALSVPTGALWATGNLRHQVISSLIGQATNLTGVTIALYMDWGLVGLMSALLASRVVDASVRIVMFRTQYARLPGSILSGPLDPVLRARMISFAKQALVLSLLYFLLFDRIEVFVLEHYAPSREIAFFSITLTLVQYLLLIPTSLSNSVSVNTFVAQGRDPKEAIRTAAGATWFIFMLAAPQLFGVAALADPLLRVMYGERYLAAIPVLRLLAFFALALAASKPSQDLLVTAERQKFYIAWMLIAGVLDIGGTIVLAPRLGAIGAAIAKGSSQVFAGTGFLVYLLVKFKAHLPLWRAARLVAACIVMYLAVRFIEPRLSALVALIVCVPVGAAIFIVLLRAFRCLDATDGDRLRRLQRVVPRRARGRYLRLVDFVAPSAS